MQLGLKAKHYPEPDVEVWHENWDPVQLYARISTQWRTSVGGAVGLDYAVIYHELDRRGIAGGDFDDFMWRIGVLESEALTMFSEK